MEKEGEETEEEGASVGRADVQRRCFDEASCWRRWIKRSEVGGKRTGRRKG
jgi:hypothetical protein